MTERTLGSFIALPEEDFVTRLPAPAPVPRELRNTRCERPSAGRKDDAGKVDYDLVPPTTLEALARAMAVGADKYGRRNYLEVPEWSRRYYSALLRHLEAWRRGETLDVESGLSHLDHVLACACILRECEQYLTERMRQP